MDWSDFSSTLTIQRAFIPPSSLLGLSKFGMRHIILKKENKIKFNVTKEIISNNEKCLNF